MATIYKKRGEAVPQRVAEVLAPEAASPELAARLHAERTSD